MNRTANRGRGPEQVTRTAFGGKLRALAQIILNRYGAVIIKIHKGQLVAVEWQQAMVFPLK